MALTDSKIKSIIAKDKIIKLSDSGGLYIEARPTGSKFFRIAYRYKVAGKLVQRIYTVGQYPNVTLAQARKELAEIKDLLAKNIEPNEYKKRKIICSNTVEKISKEYINLLAKKVVPHRLTRQKALLNKYILPKFSNVEISDIKRNDLLTFALELEKYNLKTVPNDALTLLKSIIDYAVDKGIIEYSPYSSSIKKHLKKYAETHHPHVSENELPKLLSDIELADSALEYIIGLKLTIMLFPRASEIRLAKWERVDFENSILTIPSENMKGARHLKEAGKLTRQIALPTQAISLLRQLEKITKDYEFLLPSRNKKGAISDATMNKILNTLGYKNKQNIHGFRGLASTILNTYYPEKRYIIELCLAHKVGSEVERAYNHAQQLTQQREVWQLYADFLEDKGMIITQT